MATTMKNHVKNVEMGHLGVMEIAYGATINAQMALLQVIDYKISICKL